MATDSYEAPKKPISNPFGTYYGTAANDNARTMILRTKKGDRSVEIEIPRADQEMSEFVIPVSPAFKDGQRTPASADAGMVDESYKDRPPTFSDREIVASMPSGPGETDAKRHEIEEGLNLVPSSNETPERDTSYLAGIDRIKQLYRLGRYEAALIESDILLQQYQTDPKIYEMRGTLLDRLGKTELAIKSWQQALHLNPKNLALRRFIERKQKYPGGK
ncbi:MAG: tetratricopeptide repeat protein [Bdellovibrionota bacterium]